jgi:hypothetical protein
MSQLRPELFDTVEVILDIPNENIRAGMQGTIIEDFSDGAYLVEFANEYGETLELSALKATQFIVVWRNATQEPVPLAEQAAALVAHLPEATAHQVLDFARFLAVRSQPSITQKRALSAVEQPVFT